MNSYNKLINQIDEFIRKYYKNRMFKGLLFFVGISLFTFLLTVTLEFFGRFSSPVRAFLFFSFLSINSYVFIKYFFIPFLKIYSFGKCINRFQASEIIGNFFPDISDRLLNTLQLNESLNEIDVNYELMRASVLQRSNALSVYSFSKGIDIKRNLVYLKYIIPLFLIFISSLFFFPSFVKQGAERVVFYSSEFKPSAPFKFLLKESVYVVNEGDDLSLQLNLKGNNIPEKVYIHTSRGKFLMTKVSKNEFLIVLRRLSENSLFNFEANGFTSDLYKINVIPKSAVGKFQAFIEFPSYLGMKNEKILNAGDLLIPEGSKITWSVETKNTEKIKFLFKDTIKSFLTDGFSYSKKFFNSSPFSVVLFNNNIKKFDTLFYKIDVIKDQFPSIEVSESIDSISEALRFFEGNISDDYGLSSLVFVYDITKSNGHKSNHKLNVTNPSGNNQPFRFAVDFRRENLSVKDKIEYYFIVRDNDGVNGSKSTRSKTFVYELPTLSELNDKRDEIVDNNKTELNKLIEKTKEFKKNIENLKKEVTNSKSTDWNQKNQVNQLKEERNSIQNQLEKLQMMMNESLSEKNQLSEMDKELLEKQELLEQLLNEVMDDELKDLLNKLEELMKNQDKNQLQDNLDKLDLKSDDMKKQLDRSLEMLKRLQVNEKIDDFVKELKELSKEQEQLKNDISKDLLSNENAHLKQEEINKKFKELKKELEDLNKLNEDLKKPLDLNNQEELKNEITDELKKAKDNLSDKKQNKAKQNQENSSKKMDEMAEQLENSKKESNKKQDEEDMNSLRNILESLLTLSFTQEDIMKKFSKVRDKDPYYNKLGKQQRRIIDDTKIVEDSLNAIATRQPKIASFVTKELNDINLNFSYALENIDEHRKRDLGNNLQFVMTAYNNLALMLNETLQQMQQQMQQMAGSGSCEKPGDKGKKPTDGDSEDMKETLKKQLEKMQRGQNPGGQKPGDKDGQGSFGLLNKEIAKMAAQQTAIRQKLEQMRNELNKDGKGQGNALNPLINDLEKQERDLINQRFSKDMINRQKDILTRLLESEKALMERGFDERRESKVGKNSFLGNQKRIDEYNNQKLKQIDLLRSIDPVFKKYYKDKAYDYFNFVN
jgi:hypothetical protein